MYNYCKQHNFPTDKKTRRLTQLFDTNNEYMSFSSYYLWFLIDRFGFIIDDIKSIMTFTKTDGFNSFATEFMNERQKADLAGNKGKGLFLKTALNGSYGYDALNTAKYHKNTVCNRSRAKCWVQSQRFRDVYDIGDETYLVSLENTKYDCKTCIHCAFFNLDNAKYWYLVFVYDFMYKCLDVNRFHFIEGDTDSMYWAITVPKRDDRALLVLGVELLARDPEQLRELAAEHALVKEPVNSHSDRRKVVHGQRQPLEPLGGRGVPVREREEAELHRGNRVKRAGGRRPVDQITHRFIKELVNISLIVSCIFCLSIEVRHFIKNKNI